MKLSITIFVVLFSYCSARNTGTKQVPYLDYSIVGGHEVEPHSRPYQVYMTTFGIFMCGGSILTNDTVLTSGKECCTHNHAEVIAGAHDLSKDEITVQRRTVVNSVIHPKFYENSLDVPHWDTCILKLDKDLEFNEHVGPVKLPEPNQKFTSNDATVSGWGQLYAGGELSEKLQVATVRFVDYETCNSAYQQLTPIDQTNMICYGDSTKDACIGDSGGPLMCGDTICGTVSWGMGCALSGYPGVYGDVVKMLDFINENK